MRDAQLATATGEDEQGSGASFRRQAETEQSGLCEDDVAPHIKSGSVSVRRAAAGRPYKNAVETGYGQML